jgi:hypothetical protein
MDVNTAAEIIEQEYTRLRNLWFTGTSAPALLQFIFLPSAVPVARLGPNDWGFDHAKNVLTCVITQGDLDDNGLAKTDFEDYEPGNQEALYHSNRLPDWATWRINLVHELCHESEFKILNGVATQSGWDLFNQKVLGPSASPRWTPHWKHPIAFYSAIANFAGQFGIAVERLHDRL